VVRCKGNSGEIRIVRWLFALLLFFVPITAKAEWTEIKTDHFLIYADKSDKDLRRFAEQLEAVHFLMLRANGLKEDRLPVRVKVYAYGSADKVGKLASQPNAVGFYRPGPSGAIAVIPANAGSSGLTSLEVLFHEYAHHFMLQYFPAAYPAWYVEGWAELIATSSFERKGAITFGKANSDRAGELEFGYWTHAGELVSKPRGELPKVSQEAFYGQSWLLAHYLTLSPERSQQLRMYLNGINRGFSQQQAASFFGDLDAFNKDVRGYLSRRNFEYKAVPLPEGLLANYSSRKLSAAEIDLMEEQIEFRRPMEEAQAKTFLEKLRTKVARHGSDPTALLLLGEAELDMKNHDAARAVADRLLAIAPDDSHALTLKAQIELHFAKDAEDAGAAITPIRDWIAKAKAVDPQNPLPHIALYESYAVEGERPSAEAIEGLREAVRLVPQSDGARFQLATALFNRDGPSAIPEATKLLRPIAFDPHGGDNAEQAIKLIAAMMGETLDDNANPADTSEEGEKE
jgi:cytochrome c-type biogenesis protein CcmH/NrfG